MPHKKMYYKKIVVYIFRIISSFLLRTELSADTIFFVLSD